MIKKTINPVFIFSLPRSGSTFLQRILASHPDISTTAEPWLLLPFLYAFKAQGVYTEYWHKNSCQALNEFFEKLPNRKDDYLKELRLFILNLYEKASSHNSIYFLDKTPRYHLIVNDVIKLFPEGKFIFLWRNPLAICASSMNSYAKGKWNLGSYNIDLFDGVENLTNTFENNKNKVFSIQFEDLVRDPKKQINKLLQYLELPYHANLLEKFQDVKLTGSVGDAIGSKHYSDVSSIPLNKWKKTLNNPVRKVWSKRYLNWIGKHRLNVMGYNLDSMLKELKESSFTLNLIASDFLRITLGLTFAFLEPRIMRIKLKALLAGKKIFYHR